MQAVLSSLLFAVFAVAVLASAILGRRTLFGFGFAVARAAIFAAVLSRFATGFFVIHKLLLFFGYAVVMVVFAIEDCFIRHATRISVFNMRSKKNRTCLRKMVKIV